MGNTPSFSALYTGATANKPVGDDQFEVLDGPDMDRQRFILFQSLNRSTQADTQPHPIQSTHLCPSSRAFAAYLQSACSGPATA